MTPARFTFYNVAGAILWVVSLCLAGYWFGNLPWVKSNLTLVILIIIGLSLMPLFIAWLRHRQSPKAS
jgi:membrane-associated protein